MKKLCIALAAASILGLAACATTEAPVDKSAAGTNVAAGTPKAYELGSRIPRTTTDRVVKKTERDLADEPVKTIGNLISPTGN